MLRKRFVSQGHIWGLVLSLILLVAVAAASFIEFQEYIQVADETRSINSLLNLVRSFVAESFEAQANERSYLLLRSDRYREAYQRAVGRLQVLEHSPVMTRQDVRYRELFRQLSREVTTQIRGMDVEIRHCLALDKDVSCRSAISLQATVLSVDRVYAFRDGVLLRGEKDLAVYRSRTRLHAQLCALIASVGCIGVFILVFLSANKIKRLLEEQSLLNRELLKYSDELQNIADSVPQLLWRMKEDGTIEYANRRWTEFTGLPINEHGFSWLALLHSDDQSNVLELFKGNREARTPFTAECRLRDSRGAYRWFLLRALSIQEASTSDWRWYGTFTDISDQKQAESALKQSNQDLRQFAFIAAHDLQEPVRNTANLCGLILKEFGNELAPTAIRWLEESGRNSRRMLTMIKDLLAFSMAVETENVMDATADSESCLATALANLRTAIREADAKIVHDRLPVVRIGESQLVQLFQNIIGNALKYRHPEKAPVIRVHARKDGYEYVFLIADNGIGFDPVYSRRIFQIFKRLHSNQEYDGNGIGLAVCARIVAHFGGRIWAESERGKGATFFFTLPPAEKQAEVKTMPSAARVLTSGA